MIYGECIILKLKNGKTEKIILDNINFGIKKGRITCFLGKNGSGKTSLLRCITNLEKNYTGKILYDGMDVKRFTNKHQAKTIGFVFQNFNLFNNMTVLNNCVLTLKNIMNISDKEAIAKALSILQKLDIENCKNLYPTKISQGQRQKAAIARVLITNPTTLIFDEPTASLDPESAKKLSEIILDLNKEGITIALSSQDSVFVKSVLDQCYILDSGKIKQSFDKQECPDGIDNFMEQL